MICHGEGELWESRSTLLQLFLRDGQVWTRHGTGWCLILRVEVSG